MSVPAKGRGVAAIAVVGFAAIAMGGDQIAASRRVRVAVPPEVQAAPNCLVELVVPGPGTDTSSSKQPCALASIEFQVPRSRLPATVTLTAPGYWSPSVLVDESKDTVAIKAWAMRRFQIPVNSLPTLGGTAEVAFEGTGMDRQPTGKLPCVLTLGRQLQCDLPDARLNLRLAIGDYVPEYFWAVAPGEASNQPLRTLRVGGSICGWVGIPRDLDLGANVVAVTTKPALPKPALKCFELTDSSERRCFFQIAPVLGGSYDLRAIAEGVAASASSLIEKTVGPETCLPGELRLQALSRLTIAITPPADATGRNWAVSLFDEDQSRSRTSNDGTAIFDRLPKGEYRLTVQDSKGALQRELQTRVTQDEMQEFIDLNLMQVSGSLTCRDAPVRGTMHVVGRGAPSAAAELDEEGRFQLMLPEGRFDQATVRAADKPYLRHLDFEVDTTDGRDRSGLSLSLPNTRIDIRVITEDGKAVAGAAVNLVSERRKVVEAYTAADKDGRVRFDCLRPGTMLARATAEAGESEFVEVVLREDDEKDVELVIRKTRKLQGRVEFAGQPVQNARVFIHSASGSQSSPVWRPASTDAAGVFTMEIPEGTVDLVVVPAGLPTTFLKLPSVPEGIVQVTLTGDYGLIRLRPFVLDEDRSLMRNGVVIDTALLRVDWLNTVGASVVATEPPVVPVLLLQTGAYLVCTTGQANCRTVVVVPGAEIDLDAEPQSQP